MWIQDDIRDAAQRLGIELGELTEAEVTHIFTSLERDFANRGTAPLWERLQESEAVHDARSWALLGSFIKDPVLLLVEDAQGKCGFRFAQGAAISQVLEECPGFEFYVTDDSRAYLLCFNHHDVLIGAGDAASWVRESRESPHRS